jgi:5-methylcytosine-specific restriction endonuclease McrA
MAVFVRRRNSTLGQSAGARTRFRIALSEAQNHRCAYCRHPMELIATPGRPQPALATIDHVQALVHGGSSHPDNLVAACRRCNAARGHRNPSEFARIAAAFGPPGCETQKPPSAAAFGPPGCETQKPPSAAGFGPPDERVSC